MEANEDNPMLLLKKDGTLEETIAEEISCSLCLQLPLDPYSCTQCISVYCQKCIDPYYTSKCPVCQQEFTNQSPFAFPNNILQKLLSYIKVNCENKQYGCEQQYQCDQVEQEKHMKMCKFKKQVCPNSGCSQVVFSHEFQNHFKNCSFQNQQTQINQQKLNNNEEQKIGQEIDDELINQEINHNNSEEEQEEEDDEQQEQEKQNNFSNDQQQVDDNTIKCQNCNKQFTLEQYQHHDETKCKMIDKFQNLTAEQLRLYGNEHFKLKQYKKALKLYLLSDEKEKNEPKNLSNIAITYIKLQQYQQSLNISNKGLIFYPQNFKLHLRKGDALFLQNRFQFSIQSYKMALQYGNDQPINVKEQIQRKIQLAEQKLERIRKQKQQQQNIQKNQVPNFNTQANNSQDKFSTFATGIKQPNYTNSYGKYNNYQQKGNQQYRYPRYNQNMSQKPKNNKDACNIF